MPAELVAWDDFLRGFRWRQGEHATLLGPTGSGKSTLATAIAPRRRYVIWFVVKPSDPALRAYLKKAGYVIVKRWADLPPIELAERVAFWPPIDDVEQIKSQRAEFIRAIRAIYKQRGWCVVIDELEYVSSPDFLGLAPMVRLLYQHGRSLGVTIVGATQRPAHVPLAAYSQPRHLFFWQASDVADLKRLREIGSRVDPRELQAEIQALDYDAYEFLYLDARTGRMVKSIAIP